MEKALIIGIGGFIGSHLAEYLLEKDLKIYGTVYNNTKNIEHLNEKVEIFRYDIRDKKEIESILNQIKPDYIFFLATMNFVGPSWEDPKNTLETNIFSTLYLLDAVKKTNLNPIIEIISSSAVYGLNYPDEVPVKENKEFRPLNPYAVSKIGVDMLAYFYSQAYNMKIIRIRPFNITGPRRTSDVCSDFAKGIVEIEKGHKTFLNVGNLDTIRDITDVRDAVKAMWILSQKGIFGEAYNLCSGKGYKIHDLLNILISFSEKKEKIKIHQDLSKLRKTDDVLQIGDNSKLSEIGWKPDISIEKTLKDMLIFWDLKIEQK